jgi:DNA-binding transcriptional ArsR family regulator
MPSAIPATPEFETRDTAIVARPSDVQSLLELLTDADCRAILTATTDEALTAREVSEDVDLPLSTTYRKLEALTDAGFLAEGTRFDSDGSHPSQYRRAVADVVVSVAADGAALTVVRRSQVRETQDSGR